MDYIIGQRLFIVVPAVMHGITVKNSYQIIKASFIHKTNDTTCVKIEFESSVIQETILCVENHKVYDNFKDAISGAYTEPVVASVSSTVMPSL